MVPSPTQPILLLTADDLGYTPGVTQGIIEAHQSGVVTCASLMVNTLHAERAVALVRTQAPQLDVGLHLNLTRGRPLAPVAEVRALVNRDGEFCLGSAEEFNAAPTDQIEREVHAQAERFVELVGAPPTHLNLHRRWLEDTPVWSVALATAVESKAFLRARRDETRRRAREAGASVCDSVIGDVGIRGSEPEWTFDHLLLTLSHRSAGLTELVCHPGHAYDEELRASSYNWQREAELRLLSSSRLRQHVARFARLATFRDMALS